MQPTVCDAIFACVALWPDPPPHETAGSMRAGLGQPTWCRVGCGLSADVVQRMTNVCWFGLKSSNNDGGITPS